MDSYERVGWLGQAPTHLAIAACSVLAFVGYLGMRGVRSLRRRTVRSDGRSLPARRSPSDMARAAATAAAAINLIFVVRLVLSFRELGSITPLPPGTLALLSLPVISCGLTAVLPAFALTAWHERWWTRGERIAYSIMTASGLAFITFLNYWKLLGIRS